MCLFIEHSATFDLFCVVVLFGIITPAYGHNLKSLLVATRIGNR